MESDNALTGFASKIKFQMVGEELVAVTTYTVQAIPEQAK